MNQNEATHLIFMEIENRLSALTNVDVHLHEARQGCWVVVPTERTYLHSKLWRTLRAGHKSGIGTTAIEASLLFAWAMGAVGPRKIAPKYRAREWLINLLSDGLPIQVEKIKAMAFNAGITWSSVDRAAREVCISRRKCGFRGGWVWVMPIQMKFASKLRDQE